MRKIYIIGSINEAAYSEFSQQLAELERKSTQAAVNVELCSDGGTGLDALAFYGRIRSSPCPVHITAFGCVQSAATIVLASGDWRSISPSTWFMVHDDAGTLKGETSLLVTKAQQMERQEQQWAELLAQHSDAPAHVWRTLSKETTYLTAKQVYQYGLVDEILKEKPRYAFNANGPAKPGNS